MMGCKNDYGFSELIFVAVDKRNHLMETNRYPSGLTTRDQITHYIEASRRFPNRSCVDVFLAELKEAGIGYVASNVDLKVCGRCGFHIDSLRPN